MKDAASRWYEEKRQGICGEPQVRKGDGSCILSYSFEVFCGMISVCLKGWWQGEDTEKSRPFSKGDRCAAPI